MHRVEEVELHCPYCAESITMLIDGSVQQQRYIEDCEVCCRPIVLSYVVDEDENVQLIAQREDE